MSDDPAGDESLASNASPSPRRFGPHQAWLAHLVAVTPIAQSRTDGDTIVTLNALESFIEGIRIQGRVTNDNARTKVRRCGYPSLSIQVRDDRGGEYDHTHGSGSGTYDEWECAVVSERALDPTAQRLVIVVSEIEWQDFSKPPLEWVVARQTVDFTFEVAVPHAG